MAKHRTHSIEFKRQVAQDFIAGKTLHGLAKRHDISRNLIRIWVKKLEAGARTCSRFGYNKRFELKHRAGRNSGKAMAGRKRHFQIAANRLSLAAGIEIEPF